MASRYSPSSESRNTYSTGSPSERVVGPLKGSPLSEVSLRVLGAAKTSLSRGEVIFSRGASDRPEVKAFLLKQKMPLPGTPRYKDNEPFGPAVTAIKVKKLKPITHRYLSDRHETLLPELVAETESTVLNMMIRKRTGTPVTVPTCS